MLATRIIASTMIVWPHALDLPDEPTPVIPVELVSISEETNIRATAADETPPQPHDQPPPPGPLGRLRCVGEATV